MSAFIFMSSCTSHIVASPAVGFVSFPKSDHYRRRRCLEKCVNHGKILLYNEHSKPVRCGNRKVIMMDLVLGFSLLDGIVIFMCKLCFLPASCWSFAWLIRRPWRWRRQIPKNCWVTFSELQSVISQMVELFRICTNENDTQKSR
jgi:hypothetical protein